MEDSLRHPFKGLILLVRATPYFPELPLWAGIEPGCTILAEPPLLMFMTVDCTGTGSLATLSLLSPPGSENCGATSLVEGIPH